MHCDKKSVTRSTLFLFTRHFKIVFCFVPFQCSTSAPGSVWNFWLVLLGEELVDLFRSNPNTSRHAILSSKSQWEIWTLKLISCFVFLSLLYAGSDGQSASHARHLQDFPASQFLNKGRRFLPAVTTSAFQRAVFSDLPEIHLARGCFSSHCLSTIYAFIEIWASTVSVWLHCLVLSCKNEACWSDA